jgi:hypothetical protein
VICVRRFYALSSVVFRFLGSERQTMMNNRLVVSMLRRDVLFIWHAVIAVIFICFAGLALGAALIDFVALPS